MIDDANDHEGPKNGHPLDGDSILELPTIDYSYNEDAEESAARTPPLPAATAPELYKIEGSLGQGGMAVVNLAIDTRLERPVAIKRLRKELADNTEARNRFFAEAKILAGLDHPGVVPVYEAGRLSDGDHFYAMKRVKGRTLRDVLRERMPGDLSDFRVKAALTEIFLKVCQAVAAAHQQGVIHRDLKPENIMVDDLGVVYVMDWGLAKKLEDDSQQTSEDSTQTRLGAVLGTPAYMAPEQAQGKALEADRQADVFSLGVMLYELLTGINPFLGKTAGDSMKGIVFHEPDPPAKVQPRTSRVLSAICVKALQKDPFGRYPSAVELANDLQQFQEFRPVSAFNPRIVDRVVNWSRRRPRMATTVATLAATLVVVSLGVAFQASVENTMVAGGYSKIEEINTHVEAFRSEVEVLKARNLEGEAPEVVEAVSRDLALAEARMDSAEEAKVAIAMAIAGFTVVSPDQRAVSIVRDSLLEDVKEQIEVGDFPRAIAKIELALDFSEGQNLFGFSPDEVAMLRKELIALKGEIEGR